MTPFNERNDNRRRIVIGDTISNRTLCMMMMAKTITSEDEDEKAVVKMNMATTTAIGNDVDGEDMTGKRAPTIPTMRTTLEDRGIYE